MNADPIVGDINGDCVVNVVDVQLVVNGALGVGHAQPPGACGDWPPDLDADGDVDVVEVQRVVNIALGVLGQLTISALDKVSSQPGGVLTLTGIGFDPSTSPLVQFSSIDGFSVQVPPIAVTSTSMQVVVPPYLDPNTGDSGSSPPTGVTVQVIQTSSVGQTVKSNQVGPFQIGFVAFTVSIDLNRGTVIFPNKYFGWQVGGSSVTNFVAYPNGWTVGGSSGANFIAVPPGWTVGGNALSNFVALPPGWTTGGAATTNFIALPPGWTLGGATTTNFVALPPGWTAGGSTTSNFTALPPGWSVGGASGANFIAVPPGWTVGGSALSNFVALAPGWSTGGAATTNFVALPPNWIVSGSSTSEFVSVAPGWTVGGSATTNFVVYPSDTLQSLEIKFDDAGFLGLFQTLQSSGTYTDFQLADIVTAAYLNAGTWRWPNTKRTPPFSSPSGQW
jgi:hypothetical protein